MKKKLLTIVLTILMAISPVTTVMASESTEVGISSVETEVNETAYEVETEESQNIDVNETEVIQKTETEEKNTEISETEIEEKADDYAECNIELLSSDSYTVSTGSHTYEVTYNDTVTIDTNGYWVIYGVYNNNNIIEEDTTATHHGISSISFKISDPNNYSVVCELYQQSISQEMMLVGSSYAYVTTHTKGAYVGRATYTFKVSHTHTYPESTTVTVPSTCTKHGSKTEICSICGNEITTTLPLLKHEYVVTSTTNSTCSETGLEIQQCVNCGKTISTVLSKVEHTMVDDPAVSATCTENGKTAGKHCSVCGEIIEAQEIIPMLGHTWGEGVVTREATCTEDGVCLYTCTVCGDTRTEAIPATGHSFTNYVYNNDATLTADGTKTAACDNGCGETDTQIAEETQIAYDTPVLKTPVNVTGGVKVSWNTVKNAKQYKVFYKVAGSSWKSAGITKGTSYTVTGLTSGKTYYFTVRCIATDNKTYKSSYDKTGKSILYLAAIKPSTSNGSTGITVKWTKVVGATGYIVYRKSGSGSYARIKTITSNATVSYTDTAVKSKNGILYTYAVRAYKGSTLGAFTGMGLYRLTTVSGSAYMYDDAELAINLQWSKNSSATGYQIQYSTSSTFASGNKTVNVTGASKVSTIIYHLTWGNTYYFRVRPYKTSGSVNYYGGWSSRIIAKHNYYVIPDSNSRYLTADDVSWMSSKQIMYAKNEIYARRGYIFKDKELKAYFNDQAWYKPKYSDSDYVYSLFNAYERKNLTLLKKYQ